MMRGPHLRKIPAAKADGGRGIYRGGYPAALLILAAVLVFLCAGSITLGVAKIRVGDVFRIIGSHLPFIGKYIDMSDISGPAAVIVWKMRLPRALLAVFSGAGLSLCGGVYQGLFRNPMADPYILGISSGASFAAALAIAFGGGAASGLAGYFTGVGMCAFAGAVLTTLLVYAVSRTGGRLPTATLLLTGVAFHFLLSAGMTLVMVLKRSAADNIVLWTMGSLSNASWKSVLPAAAVIVLCGGCILCFARNLNIMATGEETAESLGVHVERSKMLLLSFSALIVAVCVANCGVIGFVGLIIPHIVRLMVRPDHRVLLPFSAVIGGMFMLICDTLARNLLPWLTASAAEMPVGVITSCFGAPFFIWLLLRSKKRMPQ